MVPLRALGKLAADSQAHSLPPPSQPLYRPTRPDRAMTFASGSATETGLRGGGRRSLRSRWAPPRTAEEGFGLSLASPVGLNPGRLD